MSEAEAKPAPSNRKFYLLVAAFLLAAALAGVFSARRGKSSVEQWKDEMRAKGEKFTIAELLPKRTGPATNRVGELVRLGRLLGSSSRALSTIEHFRYLSNGVAEAAWMRPKLGLSAATSGITGRGIPSSMEPYEWEDLAADVMAMETTLAEVHRLLVVPDRDTGWDYQQRTPMPKCFVEKRHLAQWLAAANTLALHERQPAQAVAHLTALGDMLAWHDEDFTIIGQMIRVAIGGMALHSTWATMQAPGLTEAQLADLQARWQALAIKPAFARALEFERAGVGERIAATCSGEHSFVDIGAGMTGAGKIADGAYGLAWRVFAAEADELYYLQLMQDQIGTVRKEARLRSWADIQSDRAAIHAKVAALDTGRGRMLMVSRIAIPNLLNAGKTGTRYETFRELTVAALAVERFRRKHGRAPASLSDLVPVFLPAVPVDWMDGKPLRYRLNPDGAYTLWSIGEDLKDDGGDGSDAAPATRTTDIWDRKDALWPRPPP